MPTGACVYGYKGYRSSEVEGTLLEETGVKLVPTRRKDMKEQNTLSEFFALKRYRHNFAIQTPMDGLFSA